MALNIGKGTYAVYYNYQEVEGIESVDFQTDTETVDITTIKGEKVTFEKNHSAAVELTFVDTGIENLKKIVGDAWLDDAEQIPGQDTGNVVNNTDGAIALGYTGSVSVALQAPLQFVPAVGAGDHTITMFDAVATLSDITIEDQVVKATVTVRSEATGVQILKGAVTLVS
jgi:hypothetical protein